MTTEAGKEFILTKIYIHTDKATNDVFVKEFENVPLERVVKLT